MKKTCKLHILVSLNQVNFHSSLCPGMDAMADERQSIERYVEALLECPPFINKGYCIDDGPDNLISMQRQTREFLSILSCLREQWNSDLLEQIRLLRSGMGLTENDGDGTFSEKDMATTGEHVFRQIHDFIRLGIPFWPSICEGLGRVAHLFSSEVDDSSLFYDAEMDSARIPTKEQLRVRLEQGREYWLVAVVRYARSKKYK